MDPSQLFIIGFLIVAGFTQYLLLYYYPSNRGGETVDRWNFFAVSDTDLSSRNPDHFEWTSNLQSGTLIRDDDGTYTIEWGESVPFTSHISYKNRSMELSALEFYQDRLLGFCDRSGIIFDLDLVSNQSLVTALIRSGSGASNTPFKTEWATIYEKQLYVGSFGREWTQTKGGSNSDLKWVKVLDQDLNIANEDWTERFDQIAEAFDPEVSTSGYVSHEAVTFDPLHREWLFLPRRASSSAYSEAVDAVAGSNVMVIADEKFEATRRAVVGEQEAEWGFSAIAVLPRGFQNWYQSSSHPTLLLAIKVQEGETGMQSKIAVFDTEGTFYTNGFLPVPLNTKLEGLTFVPKNWEDPRVTSESAEDG